MTITRADLESKLRQIESVLDETKTAAKGTGIVIAVAVVAIVAAAFVFGKRKGKKLEKTRVEVYRIRG